MDKFAILFMLIGGSGFLMATFYAAANPLTVPLAWLCGLFSAVCYGASFLIGLVDAEDYPDDFD